MNFYDKKVSHVNPNYDCDIILQNVKYILVKINL